MLMPSIAGEQPKLCRSAPGDPSNRSLRSHGRHSDGSASPPPIPRRSGRIPAMGCVVNACASVRLCRSLPSFAFHLASPVICRERASRRERDGSMPFQPGAARATVRACRVRKTIHPTLAHSDGNRASSCAHTRSERPLPADFREPASMPAASSLCYAYGMHASRRQQQACVWESRRRWHMCVRCLGNRCDLIEVTAPNGFRLPLVAVIWVYPASPLTRGRRDVRGRPREQLSSHTSRGFASLRHRCAVCTAD